MNKRGNGFKDLSGQRFGRLLVICMDEEKTRTKHIYWLCQCDCGNPELISVQRSCLTSGHTKSCGCLQKEFIKGLGEQRKEFNECKLIDNHYEMKIDNEIVLFDIEDYDVISKYYWRLNHGYAYTWYENKPVPMHYILFNEYIYDHENRNRLDNRRFNLRKCNYTENNENISLRKDNTSGITGVGLDSRGRWAARVTVNGKRKTVYAGWDFEEAVKARLKAEKEYYGEFAPQKHLYEQYGIV